MSIKDLIFQKGGIGVSMSRPETVERLNPLIRRHMALNHGYNYVIARCGDTEVVAALNASQKTARADVGKLMECVFSAGGTAYNGVDLEPGDFDLGASDDAMLFALRDEEQAFQDALTEELKEPHQIRTRAVLTLVRTHGEERLQYLKATTKRRRKPVPTSE